MLKTLRNFNSLNQRDGDNVVLNEILESYVHHCSRDDYRLPLNNVTARSNVPQYVHIGTTTREQNEEAVHYAKMPMGYVAIFKCFKNDRYVLDEKRYFLILAHSRLGVHVRAASMRQF